MESHGGLEVIELLTECQREACEALHVMARGSVQPLNVASRNQVHIGNANDWPTYGGSESRSTVLALWMVRGVVRVHFHNLSVIHFRSKSLLYSLDITVQCIR